MKVFDFYSSNALRTKFNDFFFAKRNYYFFFVIICLKYFFKSQHIAYKILSRFLW